MELTRPTKVRSDYVRPNLVSNLIIVLITSCLLGTKSSARPRPGSLIVIINIMMYNLCAL